MLYHDETREVFVTQSLENWQPFQRFDIILDCVLKVKPDLHIKLLQTWLAYH